MDSCRKDPRHRHHQCLSGPVQHDHCADHGQHHHGQHHEHHIYYHTQEHPPHHTYCHLIRDELAIIFLILHTVIVDVRIARIPKAVLFFHCYCCCVCYTFVYY